MRKITTILLAIMCVALITSCSSNNSRKFGSRAWSNNLSVQDMALERAIIADIMGAVVADLIEPEEMSLTGLEPLEGDEEDAEDVTDDSEVTNEDVENGIEKLTINVPIEEAYGDRSYITSTVDSFEYTSSSGGTLTIDVQGQFQKLNSLFGNDAELLFTPIKVTFAFDNYVYVNSCGLFSKINGSMNCNLQGEINRITDIIEATGSCSSGSGSYANSILYDIGEDEFHEVLVQTSLRARGPWYELTSYNFFGTYTIDSRTGMIDSVVSSPLVLCQEQY